MLLFMSLYDAICVVVCVVVCIIAYDTYVFNVVYVVFLSVVCVNVLLLCHWHHCLCCFVFVL